MPPKVTYIFACIDLFEELEHICWNPKAYSMCTTFSTLATLLFKKSSLKFWLWSAHFVFLGKTLDKPFVASPIADESIHVRGRLMIS